MKTIAIACIYSALNYSENQRIPSAKKLLGSFNQTYNKQEFDQIKNEVAKLAIASN